MNPLLLMLLAGAGEEYSGTMGMMRANSLPGTFGDDIDDSFPKEKTPMERIMGAFDAYKAKKGDRGVLSPQARINQAFGVPHMEMPTSPQMAPKDRVAQGFDTPGMAQPSPDPNPYSVWPPPDAANPHRSPPAVHELPRQAPAPQGPSGVAAEPEGMSWWQRNAAMMRDPNNGSFIDPQAAARAQGIFG